jgi:hypothetical protein
MRQIITFLVSLALLSLSLLSLATPAFAQQTKAPDLPSTTATVDQLSQIRARLIALQLEINDQRLSPEIRKSLEDERTRLTNEMRGFTAQRKRITERVPIEPQLSDLSSRSKLRTGGGPTNQIARGGPETIVSHFADMVDGDLARNGSEVTISIDYALGMFILSGYAWEVEEAKTALRDALPAYLARTEELRKSDERVASEAAQRQESARLTRLENTSVNIDWKGGTLANLVTTVQSSVRCNVVLAEPSVGALVIPTISVKLVAPEVFFLSLQSIPLTDDRRLTVSIVSPDQASREGDFGGKNAEPNAADTLPVIVISEKSGSHAGSADRRVFDLSDWSGADAAGVKKLIEAINFAMEANGQESQVKVRYHEPSKILFAKGPADSVALIGDIVNATRSKK